MIASILEWIGAASMIVSMAVFALAAFAMAHGEKAERCQPCDAHLPPTLSKDDVHPLHHPLVWTSIEELMPSVCEADP